MTPQTPISPTPVPAAPPTHPGALPPRRAKWPTPLAVVTITLGALGFISTLYSIFSMWYMDSFQTPFSPPAQAEALKAAVHHWRMPISIASAAGFPLNLLLLAAGILLFKRRRLGARLVMTWAFLRILQGGVVAVLVYIFQREQLTATFAATGAAGTPGMPAAITPAFTEGIALFTLALTLLWVTVLPIFMFVWFTRASISAEVARWSALPDPSGHS